VGPSPPPAPPIITQHQSGRGWLRGSTARARLAGASAPAAGSHRQPEARWFRGGRRAGSSFDSLDQPGRRRASFSFLSFSWLGDRLVPVGWRPCASCPRRQRGRAKSSAPRSPLGSRAHMAARRRAVAVWLASPDRDVALASRRRWKLGDPLRPAGALSRRWKLVAHGAGQRPERSPGRPP